MNWWVWGSLLILQNAAFTLVSRARNSKSLVYHGVASLLSNGIWFASQFILVDAFIKILRDGTLTDAIQVGVFYTVCTLIGSLGMHYIAMHKIEKGKNG